MKLLTIDKPGPTRYKSFNKSSRSTRILILTIFLFVACSQNAVFSRGITGPPPLSDAKTPHILVLCSCGHSPLLCSWMNPAVAAGPEGVGIIHDDIFFEDPFLWYSHRWVILTIAALIVAQFILIAVLLIQRRRKALAEADLKKALTKTEQGDRMLSVLMENIPEGITISDANLNLTRVSGYGLEILGGNHEGKPVEEVISRWSVYEPDGVTPMQEKNLPLVRAVRRGEVVRDMELVQADISGKKISLLCNAAPIRDANGRITGGIVAWRDITEIKHAENEQIRISQQRQLALDAARMGWWHYSPVTGISSWDDRYKEIFGVTGYSSPNDEILKLLHPDDLPKVRAKVEAALNPEDPQPYVAEYRINLPDGSMKWIEAQGKPTFENIDGTLQATSFVGTVLDITDRKMEEKALQEKMLEYSAIFEHSIVGKAEADAETGRFIKVNQAFSDLTGYSPEELYKMTFVDLTHPEDRERDLKGFDHVKKGDAERWQIEKRYIKKDGTVIWVNVSGHRLRFEGALPDRTIAVILDITGQKNLESSLRESEQRFRLALRNAPVSIAAQDRDLRYIWAYNQRTAGLDEIIGHFDYEIFASEDASRITAIKKRILKDGIEYREQMWLARPEGPVYLDICWEPIRNSSGGIVGVASATVDMTALKKTEEKLRESEEKYRNLFNNMTEEVHFWELVRDKEGRIITWKLIDANPPTLKSWGRNTIEGIRGKTTDEIFGPGSTEHYYPIVEKIMKEGTPYYYEDYFPNLDKYFRFASVPLGEHFITTGADITSIKKAEQALKSSLNEKEVLLKEIHHRVKNNMQIISSLVSLQAGQSGDSNVAEILGDVSNRVRSMAMIHEKLYQSKDLSRIDFAQYTESLLNYLWRSYGQSVSGIILKKELKPVSLPVDKAVPLGLILNELVSNTLKHAFPENKDGEVTVTLEKGDGKEVTLSVSDNGKGLPEGFDWKETDSLGLRLVQMLASQLHGNVKSESNSGTVFKVTFGGVK